MSARVLFLGIDALDRDLASELARSGSMPNFARLLAEGSSVPIRHPYGVWVSAIWPCVATGCTADRLNYYNWCEIDPASYERRLTNVADIRQRPFWEQVSAAGRRVLVVDVPHCGAPEQLNGIFVGEWGAHDRHGGLKTWPAEFTTELVARHGLHPNARIDTYAERSFSPADWAHRKGTKFEAEELERTFDDWMAGIELKEELLLELLSREAWDLAVFGMGEAHDVGHILWHQHDPEHPRHDPELRARQGDPLVRMYERLDRSIEKLRAAAGPEAVFVLFCSHGMGPHYDGGAVLDPVLERIDRRHASRGGSGDPPVASVESTGALRRLASGSPARWQRAVAPLTAWALRRRYGRALFGPTPLPEAAYLGARRFYQVPNNDALGGVRFNRIGREAQGVVSADEIPALVELLREELATVINIETGEPVVERVVLLEERMERPAGGDTWPDLFIEWNRRRPIETVWSPSAGRVHRPDCNMRTGDHRARSLLLVADPGAPRGEREETASIDIAPTLAALVGVELEGIDGKSWMAKRAVADQVRRR